MRSGRAVAAWLSEHHLVGATERTSHDQCDLGDLDNTADAVLGLYRDEMGESYRDFTYLC